MTRLIRRTVNRWLLWRSHKAMRRAIPALRAAFDNERAARKRGCTRAIGKARREQKAAVLAALKGGV